MLNKVFSGTVKEINWKNYIKQNVEQSRIDNRFTLASRCSSKRHYSFLDYYVKLRHCHVVVTSTNVGADVGPCQTSMITNIFCLKKIHH